MKRITEAIYKEFHNRRVVHRREIVAFLNGEVTRANTAIQWLIKSGKALSIKTGLYYLKPPQEWYTDEIEVNPLILASRLHPNGMVGYHSALKCYGAAYSESRVFQVALDKSLARVLKPFEFQNARYEFYRTDISFGMASSVIDDVRVRHFSRERLLLEGLMYPDRFLGMPEFLQSIENFSWVDWEALMSMRAHYPLTTISMRLGWLLEKNQQRWHVSDAILRKLGRRRPKSKIHLIKRKTRDNFLHPRWNLMVPRTIENLSEV
jgi:predicted transcriptional regulator of viral defense system